MKRPLSRFLASLLVLLAAPVSALAADYSSMLLQKPAPVSDLALGKALAAPIVAVTDKKKPSPTGDAHDYVSYARYYWPDPTKPDGLPYVSRDGQHNREQVAAGDRGKIDQLVDNVTTLALGWSQQKREDCAKRAGDWLRAWFITPATRMNPSLEYAQVRLGHSNNRGNAAGVLDTRAFSELIEAMRLLEGSPALSADESKTIRAWFADFFKWLRTSRSGEGEYNARNNHGSWYLVQAVAIARYIGETEAARKLCEEDKQRIASQFKSDGSQPEELRRVDGLGYSAFNLAAQLQLVVLARAVGVELWHYTAPNGASLKRGLDFLRPYNVAPENWPFKQNEKLPVGFLDSLYAAAAHLDGASPAQ